MKQPIPTGARLYSVSVCPNIVFWYFEHNEWSYKIASESQVVTWQKGAIIDSVSCNDRAELGAASRCIDEAVVTSWTAANGEVKVLFENNMQLVFGVENDAEGIVNISKRHHGPTHTY